MSAVPEGWVEVELGEVWRGKRRSSVVPAKEPDRRFELYSVPSFETGVPERLYGSEIGSSKQKVAPGSVLLCRINPRINRVWVVGQAGSDPQIASTEWISLPRVVGMTPRFAMHALQTPKVRRHLTSSVSGVGGSLMRVRMDALWRTRIPLAPISEQHRIVAKIESLFAKLVEGVAALKRAEANLERYRASVLKAAVEGRLTDRWRREHPPEETGEELLRRILTERRKRWEEEQLAKFAAKGRKPPKNWRAKYKEPVTPDTSGLPGLPGGWCWATVDQVTTGNRTSAYGVLKPGPAVPGGIPLVRVGNIQNGVVSGSLKRIAHEVAGRYGRTRLRGGELLITLVGAIGRTAVVPRDLSGANTARAVGVVPVSSMLDPRWIELWFRSPFQRLQMIGKAHEVARKTLNLEDVRSATVALPPGCEQRAILLAVEKTERGLTPTVEHMKESRSYAATLRQSILKRAFEGRLLPQDPADEPASVHLERIRVEREAARKQRKRRRTKPRRRPKSRVP